MTVEQAAEADAPVRPSVAVPSEPGTWFLLLVPILICLGMLAFMAFAPS